MSLKSALRSHLKADAGVSAITNEVHWIVRPQTSPLPAVVLTVVNTTTHRDLDGANGYSDSRIQFSAFATSATTAANLAAAIIAACEGSFTAGGEVYTLQGEPESFDRGRGTDTAFVYESLVEMRFHHNG